MYIELFNELESKNMKLKSISEDEIEIENIKNTDEYFNVLNTIIYFIRLYDLNLMIFSDFNELEIIIKHII